jgi:hypothetical protein
LAGVPGPEVSVRAEGRSTLRSNADLLLRQDDEEGLRAQKGGQSPMENVKVLLCPAGCGECPEVEIADDEVRIGETGNLAVLRRDEWNILVDLIQSGQLTKV